MWSYHLSVDAINKYELLKIIKEVYGKQINIIPDDTVAIDRSLDSSRLGTKLAIYQNPGHFWFVLCMSLGEWRKKVDMDLLRNKVLMITGGTGSFGSVVVKRFLDSELREIRIFSRDEKKQEDMRLSLKSSKVKFYIGDVRDYDSIHQAMTRMILYSMLLH